MIKPNFPQIPSSLPQTKAIFAESQKVNDTVAGIVTFTHYVHMLHFCSSYHIDFCLFLKDVLRLIYSIPNKHRGVATGASRGRHLDTVLGGALKHFALIKEYVLN